MSWQPGRSTVTGWEAQTAPTPSGPWQRVATGIGTQPVVLTGLHAGTTTWLRAGDIDNLIIYNHPEVQGALAAPAGC